jgi:plastocyanin
MKIKFIIPALFAGLMSVMLFSCSKSNDMPAVQDVFKVNILANQFDPGVTTMEVGYKIKWTNMDNQDHSVISDDGTSFNSGTIAPGASFTYTSVTTGTYPYHCGVHPGVTGIVYVVAK